MSHPGRQKLHGLGLAIATIIAISVVCVVFLVFALGGSRPGSHEPRHGSDPTAADTPAAPPAQSQTIEVSASSSEITRTLEGLVRDESSKPIAGATVRAVVQHAAQGEAGAAHDGESASLFHVESDGDGSFHLAGLPIDMPVVLYAEAGGYEPGQAIIEPADQSESGQIIITLEYTSGIAGVVVGANGKPMGDVVVTATTSQELIPIDGGDGEEAVVWVRPLDHGKVFRSQKTEQDGRFDLGSLPSGQWYIGAMLHSPIANSVAVLAEPEKDEALMTVSLAPSERRSVRLVLPPVSSVDGWVVNEQGGPIANALIQVWTQRRGAGDFVGAAKSDAQGAFTIDDVPGPKRGRSVMASFWLTCEKEGFESLHDVPVSRGTSGVVLQMPPRQRGSLQLKVLDARTRTPLVGTTVRLIEVLTDPGELLSVPDALSGPKTAAEEEASETRGVHLFEDIRVGTATIQVQAPEYGALLLSGLAVVEDRVTQHDVLLQPPGRLCVSIVRPKPSKEATSVALVNILPDVYQHAPTSALRMSPNVTGTVPSPAHYAMQATPTGIQLARVSQESHTVDSSSLDTVEKWCYTLQPGTYKVSGSVYAKHHYLLNNRLAEGSSEQYMEAASVSVSAGASESVLFEPTGDCVLRGAIGWEPTVVPPLYVLTEAGSGASSGGLPQAIEGFFPACDSLLAPGSSWTAIVHARSGEFYFGALPPGSYALHQYISTANGYSLEGVRSVTLESGEVTTLD